jgi:hypothetical protein
MKKIADYFKDLLQDFDSKTKEIDSENTVPDSINSSEKLIKWMLSE